MMRIVLYGHAAYFQSGSFAKEADINAVGYGYGYAFHKGSPFNNHYSPPRLNEDQKRKQRADRSGITCKSRQKNRDSGISCPSGKPGVNYRKNPGKFYALTNKESDNAQRQCDPYHP